MGGPAGRVPVPTARIAMAGGETGEEFFIRITRGFGDAAPVVGKKGGSATCPPPRSFDRIDPDAARLVRVAITRGVDGVVVPNRARGAGIWVVSMNVGAAGKAMARVATNAVGSDECNPGGAGRRLCPRPWGEGRGPRRRRPRRGGAVRRAARS